MELITDLIRENLKVKLGDILFFSEYEAYMIVHSDIEYSAIQILNNGNEELGHISYTDVNLDELVERLINTYDNPMKIVNMKDCKISF